MDLLIHHIDVYEVTNLTCIHFYIYNMYILQYASLPSIQ